MNSSTGTITPSELRALATPATNKYGARRAWVEEIGRFFDSQREAEQAVMLWRRQRAREIRDLVFQPVFHLDVNGQRVCDYVGDFLWWENTPMREMHAIVLQLADGSYAGTGSPAPGRRWVVADAKGVRTAVYRLKAKLMRACHGITIVEL